MNKKRTTPPELNNVVLAIFVIAATFSASILVASADNAIQKQVIASSKTNGGASASGRGKNLNFDGDYVETMGRNPLDSLTALSEAQKNRDNHLYRKRSEFAPETAETLKQSRFEQ